MPFTRKHYKGDALKSQVWFKSRFFSLLIGTFCLLVGASAWSRPSESPCPPTPQQTEGPFYPVHDQPEKDNDLTKVKGATGPVKGQILYISGQVRDGQCRPIEGLLVEIWQAAANGRYNHPDDQDERRPLDPNFQYWGQTTTDQEGRYQFKTITPLPYKAGPFWTRPAHVHFKVHGRDRTGRALTTQMYFAGDPYLEKDRIFGAVPPAERQRVIVALENRGPESEPGAKVCRFNLTL